MLIRDINISVRRKVRNFDDARDFNPQRSYKSSVFI